MSGYWGVGRSRACEGGVSWYVCVDARKAPEMQGAVGKMVIWLDKCWVIAG